MDGDASPSAPLGLREEHHAHTRQRILDAAVRLLANDLAELSMKAVADEAGVSRPTLYRHFSGKRALLDGIGQQYVRAIGVDRSFTGLDELVLRIPEIFERSAAEDDGMRAAMWNPKLSAERRREAPRRLALIAGVLGPELKDIHPSERDQLVMMVATLCSSATRHALRDVAGANTKQAARCVAWAVRALVAGARKKGKRR